MAKLFANRGFPDQMPHSVDMGLHCLPVFFVLFFSFFFFFFFFCCWGRGGVGLFSRLNRVKLIHG